MKKVWMGIGIALLILLAFCLPYWINDAACNRYENEIQTEISTIAEVKVLQMVHGCGNSSGTGNHTDLYVGVLVETVLSAEEVESKIPDAVGIHAAMQYDEQTLAMSIIDLQFTKEVFHGDHEYYILEFVKASPCSLFDIRGH